MYYDWYQNNRKRVGVGIIIGIILIGAWGVWIYLSRLDKIPVTISPVPRDATVTINNQPSGSGTTWLTPGKYTVKAHKDGFAAREKTITVTDSKEQNVVALGLSPESEQAKAWAEEHADTYKNNEIYGAIEAQTNGQYFQQKNPIVAHLPYNDPYFQITYSASQDNEVILAITTPSPRYRYFAIQKIREFGYDPSDFTIKFTDFKNPLE